MQGKKSLISKEQILSAIKPGHRPGAGAYTGRAGADGRDFSGGGEETFYEASVGGESGGAGAGADRAGTDDPK